jgi:drug/metabolite transporter (DMT)-like permease
VRLADTARLFALAAIWGASFIFIRVTAPVLGPAWTAEGRLLIGALVLLAWFRLTGFDPQWRRHLRFYIAVGILNSAIPFTLYGFAGMYMPGSVMAILNATSPMFGLLLGALFLGERITAGKIAGIVIGAAGVALVARPGEGETSPMFIWAVAACLFASFAYGMTGVLIKKWGADVPSRGIAVGAQVAAAVALMPLLPFMLPLAAPSALVVANLLGLGVFASGIALLLYFRLIADIGPTRALTVTFLVPVFGLFWGMLFLGESLTPAAVAGAILVLAGTLLVTRG